MFSQKPLFLKLVLLCAAEALVILGALWVVRHEMEAVNQAVNDVASLKDPSPYRSALMGHLGQIRVSLNAFVRSPDPSLERQMAESQRDFETQLPAFMRENPKLIPAAAAEEVTKSFSQLKESIQQVIAAHERRMQGRTALEQNFDRMMYLIDYRLRPVIRAAQPDGQERREAVLNIENQLRAWRVNLSAGWAQPTPAARALVAENEDRGDAYLERYARLELLSRERSAMKELHALWKRSTDIARGSFAQEAIVTQAAAGAAAAHGQVVDSLNRHLPALPPAQLEAKKRALLRTMHLHMAGVTLAGAAGVLSLAAAGLLLFRAWRRPRSALPARPSAASPTLQMDMRGTVTFWSAAAETLYGYAAAEMVGQSIGRLFDSESEIARLGQELQKAKKAVFETAHKTKSGRSMAVRIEFHVITDTAGRSTAIGLLCVPH